MNRAYAKNGNMWLALPPETMEEKIWSLADSCFYCRPPLNYDGRTMMIHEVTEDGIYMCPLCEA